MPQAPIIINASTIVYTMCMAISFVIFQLMAVSGKIVAPILDIGGTFLIYVIAMLFFATNVSAVLGIAGIVIVFLIAEYITIDFSIWRQNN